MSCCMRTNLRHVIFMEFMVAWPFLKIFSSKIVLVLCLMDNLIEK